MQICKIRSRGKLFLNGLKSVAKKKNTKKFGRFLEPHISETAGRIPFKFDSQGNETIGHL